jgi:hypothetical protein
VSLLQVKLNRGLDFVQLDDLLVDLKLTPDVLEVPVPRYFIEDRAKVRAAVKQLHKCCCARGNSGCRGRGRSWAAAAYMTLKRQLQVFASHKTAKGRAVVAAGLGSLCRSYCGIWQRMYLL